VGNRGIQRVNGDGMLAKFFITGRVTLVFDSSAFGPSGRQL
jgi:hypothetical protein